ncbi:3-hydroxyacyl-CoA dehydrogenase [Xanthobacter autotrophicus]|uniref:3-hydroxyacyl-CoA dehydrogenase n=1 Tax=Xanthobacter autotrophicus TaxID=280 RepID=UPI00372724A7
MSVSEPNSGFLPQSRPWSVAVIGAGAMGRGIAQVAAQAGMSVRLHDAVAGRAAEAVIAIRAEMEKRAAAGKLSREVCDAACTSLVSVEELADLADRNLIVEAVVEDLEVKRGLFRALEAVVSADCMLATNTSSLLVTSIARGCAHPERVGGVHFFNPVPAMKIAEVIAGARTGPATVEALRAFVADIGHAPIVAADTPGFLINHAGRGLYTEGVRIVAEGIAAPHDVDAVMQEAAGFRMGPFQLFDLTGLDVSYPVLSHIYREFFEEPRFRPAPLLRRQVEAGLYGRKVGEGFYRYADGRPLPGAVEEIPAEWAPRPVWIEPDDRAVAPWLSARLSALGVHIHDGGRPGADAIQLVLPIGEDATSAALRHGLDLQRVMAIDPLLADARRLTLMPTVATRSEVRDALVGMVRTAGGKATLIHDSPGFVAQRVLAMIVNIAADIAQQRIASPRDIDFAVCGGLGYPTGPLALGDALGPRTILTILERMQAFYGDPRYRPSPWLKRRALAACSLTHPDA